MRLIVKYTLMHHEQLGEIRKWTLAGGLAMLERGSSARLLLAILVAFACLVLAINVAAPQGRGGPQL